MSRTVFVLQVDEGVGIFFANSVRQYRWSRSQDQPGVHDQNRQIRNQVGATSPPLPLAGAKQDSWCNKSHPDWRENHDISITLRGYARKYTFFLALI